MTERSTKQFNSYLTRLVKHGAREQFGNVRGRLNRSAEEVARLRRCLSYRDDGTALSEAASQAAEAFALVDKQHALIQMMWNMDCGVHIPALHKLIPEVLAAKKRGQFLEARDKERDVKLMAEVAELLLAGASIQELVERRLNGTWVPKCR